MSTLVKYPVGDDDQVAELCEAIEAAYERAEAHRRVWDMKSDPRQFKDEWKLRRDSCAS